MTPTKQRKDNMTIKSKKKQVKEWLYLLLEWTIVCAIGYYAFQLLIIIGLGYQAYKQLP